MKKFIYAVLVLFALNIILIGIFKSQTIRTGNQIVAIETLHSAAHTKHSLLYRERQALARRDRIISYAQNNLGMELLKPDEVASGHIIKEVKEEVAKNKDIIYCFIDFITPSLNAFEPRK